EEGRGAGADFDSTSERYTEWYQRTDEDGDNVDYDFDTGKWADGYEDESKKDESSGAFTGSPAFALGLPVFTAVRAAFVIVEGCWSSVARRSKAIDANAAA